MSYSSLHVHSMYSLLDGFGTPKENLQQAQKLGLKAICPTEHSNVYSTPYYHKLQKDYPDIKILYGCELYEVLDVNVKDTTDKKFHLIVIARDELGRVGLNQIITQSNLEHFYGKPRVELSMFEGLGEHLVVCSACLGSKIAKEQDFDKCVEYINEYKSYFPYFYLEMQSSKSDEQIEYNNRLVELSKTTNTPLIISTDVHAPTKEDIFYQNKMVAIARDAETVGEHYDYCYMQSTEEIYDIMSPHISKDVIKQALDNTNYISLELCGDVSVPFQEPKLPTYPLPDGYESNYEFLKELIEIGWIKRGFDKSLDEEQTKIYRDRINYELDIIHSMNFDGYFLFVWDFVNWSKKNGVEVGAGRGSSMSSMICYLIGVTNANPIKYDLYFERFLNPERISLCDIDIDFSDRDKVINYLTDKFGEENVCQIINFSYITPIVAIKDVGKMLGFKYFEMDILSKKFTGSTFEECLEMNPNLLEKYPQYYELIDIAGKLSGRVKTVSIHAGGFCVCDGLVNEYLPMKLGSKGEHVIQCDKRIVEEIGIVKFDLLGVQTLSIVKEIKNDLQLSDWELDINNIDFETDKKSYELLCSAMTEQVFQVSSSGMKDLLLRLKPSNMEEISAVLALYRPDTMGVLSDYIACKNGDKTTEYIHPDIKPILKNTLGYNVYQEQTMAIVRQFGGRTLGGADIFRKAIGKKNVELVKKEVNKLRNEIINNGYSEEISKILCDDLQNAGNYSFCKSHSFAYAILTLQTAYLKAHYPLYFFKAILNNAIGDNGKINKYIVDAKQFNIEIKPPDIFKSDKNFSVVDDKILFGLSAIKGIGDSLVDKIIEERNISPFTGLQDFVQRCNATKAQVVSLIKSGAIPTSNKRKTLVKYFDGLFERKDYTPVTTYPTHKELLLNWDINVNDYKIDKKVDKEKVLELYNAKKEVIYKEQQVEKLKKYRQEYMEKYLDNEPFWEFEALQIFINDNPFEESYKLILKPYDEIEIDETCTLSGIVANVQKKKDRNKQTMAYISFYSSFGLIELIVWASVLKEHEMFVKKGQKIVIKGVKSAEETVIVSDIRGYQEWLNILKEKRRV